MCLVKTYLFMNTAMLLTELFYGYITNSLGLIADAIHSGFDCFALISSVMAAYYVERHNSNTSDEGLYKTVSGVHILYCN